MSKRRFWAIILAVPALMVGLANATRVASAGAAGDVPGLASVEQPTLPLALRVELLESAWVTHGIVVNDRAVLDRLQVYRYLDRVPGFESLLHVRVRESLEYDTVEADRWRSSRALVWGPSSARRLTDSTIAFDAVVMYAAQGHFERYWMRATPGHARQWSVDSITISRFTYF